MGRSSSNVRIKGLLGMLKGLLVMLGLKVF